MSKVANISLKQGTSRMDLRAPDPSEPYQPLPDNPPPSTSSSSTVSVTIAGAGGCGINTARGLKTIPGVREVLFFDTSMTNSRFGEQVEILTNGSGSGSLRAENAIEIERAIPSLSDDSLGIGDVAIVISSLAGGKLAA